PAKTGRAEGPVPACPEPAAELVAPAQMESEGGGPPGVDHRVVQFDPVAEPALKRPAACLVKGPPGWVDEQRVMRRVELDVAASEPDQLGYLVAQDRHHVGHERVQARIGRRGPLRRPAIDPPPP